VDDKYKLLYIKALEEGFWDQSVPHLPVSN
jgi:hypothetical protein